MDADTTRWKPQEAAENALELCVKGGADTVMKGLLNTNTF